MDTGISARGVALGMALGALAGCAAQPRHFIDPADRSPPGGREAVVIVSQGEIQGQIVASKRGATQGAVGALIDIGINQHRTNAAEAVITPLRTELSDYSFDQRALAATQATLTRLDWLSVKKTAFSKDVSKQNTNAILDRSAAPEVLIAVYDYALTADFSEMQVSARFTIAPKAVPPGQSPDSRTAPEHAVYSQTFTYLIMLSSAGDDMTVNCRKWSQSHAQAARIALDRGIEGVNTLLVRELEATPDQLKKLAEGENTEAHGHKGKLAERNSEGILLVEPGGTWVYIARGTAG